MRYSDRSCWMRQMPRRKHGKGSIKESEACIERLHQRKIECLITRGNVSVDYSQGLQLQEIRQRSDQRAVWPHCNSLIWLHRLSQSSKRRKGPPTRCRSSVFILIMNSRSSLRPRIDLKAVQTTITTTQQTIIRSKQSKRCGSYIRTNWSLTREEKRSSSWP